MISKIFSSLLIFTAAFYSIGCCGTACSLIPDATYDATFPDGSVIRLTSDRNGCISYDCDIGNPNVRPVVNPQV